MNAIVEAIKSMSKRKVSIILIILQYIIGFSALISFAVFYNSIHQFSNEFEKITDIGKTSLMYNSTGIEALSTEKQKPNYNHFYKYIQADGDIKNFGTYAYYSKNLVLNNLNNVEREELANDLNVFNFHSRSNIKPSSEYVQVNLMIIDEGLSNFIKFPISQGKDFSSKDFHENDMRNVLLGSTYEKYFKIGDVITLQSDKEEQLRISGFIKNNSYFYNQGVEITSSLMNLNSIIVIPINKAEEVDEQILTSRIQNGLLLQLNDNANFEDVSKKINLKATELRLSEHNEKLNTILKSIINNYINANLPKMIIGICFLVFSSVGLITSLIVTIFSKKREIGIRLACGASIFNIFNSLVLEMIFISLVSFIGAIGEYLIENKGSIQLIKKEYAYLTIIDIYGIDIFTLIELFIVVIFVLIVISLTIFKQLKKLQPKDLIGGME